MDIERVSTNTRQEYVKIKEAHIGHAGTLRISFDLKGDGLGGHDAWARVYRNGTPVGIEREHSPNSYVTFTEDISGWSVGDAIQLYYRATGSGAFVSIRNFRISVDTVYDTAVSMD